MTRHRAATTKYFNGMVCGRIYLKSWHGRIYIRLTTCKGRNSRCISPSASNNITLYIISGDRGEVVCDSVRNWAAALEFNAVFIY